MWDSILIRSHSRNIFIRTRKSKLTIHQNKVIWYKKMYFWYVVRKYFTLWTARCFKKHFCCIFCRILGIELFSFSCLWNVLFTHVSRLFCRKKTINEYTQWFGVSQFHSFQCGVKSNFWPLIWRKCLNHQMSGVDLKWIDFSFSYLSHSPFIFVLTCFFCNFLGITQTFSSSLCNRRKNRFITLPFVWLKSKYIMRRKVAVKNGQKRKSLLRAQNTFCHISRLGHVF